jgi:hypothetical protein
VALIVLALMVLLVAGLARASSRTGRGARGCCAPADPHDDLRMREGLAAEEQRL